MGAAVGGAGGVDGGHAPDAAAAAEHLAPTVMELGGKDAFIVCDDADLEQAVHASLAGCYINCGQNCVASERILVYDALYDAFEKRVAEYQKAGVNKSGSEEEAKGFSLDADF